MRKFTTKEIELCRKIAEKKKRKIQCGDYAVVEFPRLGEQVILIDTQWEKQEKGIYNYSVDEVYPNYYSIWQEHDCFEWLRERSYILRLSYQKDLMKKDIEIPDETYNGEYISREIFIRGYYFMEKPLEALLRAVLAVMEEK